MGPKTGNAVEDSSDGYGTGGLTSARNDERESEDVVDDDEDGGRGMDGLEGGRGGRTWTGALA